MSNKVEDSIGIRTVAGVPYGKTQPPKYSLRYSHNLLSPMRDGVLLTMDLIRPDASGRFPVILMRTPYNKAKAGGVGPSSAEFQQKLARHGYIVAIQDCRGRFNSDGAFEPYRQEQADGFDTIEWLSTQDWCDGNVGMIGRSYNAQTQWFAASQAPKALKAIVPIASPPGHPFLNEPFCGGIMLMAMAEWMFAMGRRSEQIGGLRGLFTQPHDYIEALPLARIADASGTDISWWKEWMRHPTYDAYWRACAYEENWRRVTVPALNVTGWWDMNFLGAPRNFIAMQRHGATESAREGQRLVIGPWPHWVNEHRTLSGLDFGPHAVTDLDTYILRFFDYWLRGISDNGLSRDPRVHVFVVGANQWWEADSWPLVGTQQTPFYLHSGGLSNTHRGNGTLSKCCPTAEPYDQFESNPLDPVRVPWSVHEGPVDDRPVSARPDVLCYTSEVLSSPLDVVGPVAAVLYASSSARDCDWHMRLVDVYPDGTARFLCHGALRARFRRGFEHATFLEPGRIERFEIDMTAVGVRFLEGHRIRLEISSTWFPRFERNSQTSATNWMTDSGPTLTAQQRIYHDSLHASHVSLPLLSRPPNY